MTRRAIAFSIFFLVALIVVPGCDALNAFDKTLNSAEQTEPQAEAKTIEAGIAPAKVEPEAAPTKTEPVATAPVTTPTTPTPTPTPPAPTPVVTPTPPPAGEPAQPVVTPEMKALQDTLKPILEIKDEEARTKAACKALDTINTKIWEVDKHPPQGVDQIAWTAAVESASGGLNDFAIECGEGSASDTGALEHLATETKDLVASAANRP